MPGAKYIRAIRAQREGATDLRRRRAWFDDEGREGQQQGESKYNPATVEDANKIIEALQKRVGERDATIEQLRTSASALSERITAIEAATRKKLEEQGNYQEVRAQLQAEIEALKPSAERAAALEQIIRESNEARIGRVPEAVRSMIPMDYAPERLQAWLNANEGLLLRKPAPNYDAGAGAGSNGSGGRPPDLTAEELNMAKRMKMTPEQYQAAKAKIGKGATEA
ncbi:MAG: hypothetical protein BroJett033_7970 [Chloroflexota bacterium]|nr:MAG: hypothetical protein BroJett033_7970 [Chloroflexota bacterium]